MAESSTDLSPDVSSMPRHGTEDPANSVKKLVSSAKEVGKSTGEATTSAKNILQQYKGTVKDFRGKISDSAQKFATQSRGYFDSARGSAQDLGSKITDTAGIYHAQFVRVFTKRGTSSSTDRSVDGSESDGGDDKLGFPMNIVSWCSALCSRKSTKERSVPSDPAPESAAAQEPAKNSTS